ncbi:conjugation peptidase TraF. Serine peptidase. MEROPS family S26C [Nitrosospira multiformis]|uniref:Conjugation peptidase TraF. Serine peptidase. MEROPS family S26C n=1 Tax=Nitrosospira multiformis TaxID=1231 RepID=A0A1H8N7W4_9PROT|nr:conjugative transfer signal peptidase TraF [Nitrosospira multiformis]SEO25697.1 conjugation peptidase TraF. Serine peptidase. MEROPS family S26C [Nitrosospira multiformis]
MLRAKPIMIMGRVSQTTAVAALGLLVLGFMFHAAGLRVNVTKSIPIGLYQLSDVPVRKGEYVIFCPPESTLFDEARSRGYIGAGFCPGGYGYMMKRVWAVAGDVVTWGEEGITVNGKLLPASAPREADSAGRTLPQYTFSDYTLKESELLLMSDVSWASFDSRYFGPVDAGKIRGVIRPMVTL